MTVPVQITFRELAPSPALAAHVEKRAAKLNTFCEHIRRCHVVVEAPHRRHKHGERYNCRIDLYVPGKELVVTRTANDQRADMHAAIDDAFRDAERCLEEHMRVLQSRSPRSGSHHGVVSKIFPERGYGFISRADEEGPEVLREVYFRRNSVVGGKFARLSIGAKVRFSEEDGDKGPQASTVHVES